MKIGFRVFFYRYQFTHLKWGQVKIQKKAELIPSILTPKTELVHFFQTTTHSDVETVYILFKMVCSKKQH